MSNTNPTSSVNSGSNVNNNRSVDRDARPSGNPKVNQDFKKILGKSKDDSKDEEDDLVKEVPEEGDVESSLFGDLGLAQGKQVKPRSLFDLATTKQFSEKEPTPPPTESPLIAQGQAVVKTPVLKETPVKEMPSDKGSVEDSDSDSGQLISANSKLAGGSSDSLAAISREGKDSGGSASSDADSNSSSNFSSKQGQMRNRNLALGSDGDKISLLSPRKAEDETVKVNTKYNTEQADLSYVNPTGTQVHTAASLADAAVKPPAHTSNIQEIINQLVDKMYEIKTGGQTDTTIVLKQPPMFAGVNIVVTSFDSAKGEFNLSFQNLSQMAKNLLDMRVNQDSLKSTLEQKGYAIHIVTTTTEIENVVALDQTQQGGKQDREGQNQNQQRRQKSDSQSEDESNA